MKVKKMIGACVLLQIACTGEVGQTSMSDEVAVRSEPLLTDCNEEQGQLVAWSLLGAEGLFTQAGMDVGNVGLGGDATRFDFWFGDHESSTLTTVARTLRAAATALRSVQIDCGCNLTPEAREMGANEDNTVAWTTHDDPNHLIHLCPLFYQLDLQEFGPGTILHEATHFVGADDIVNTCDYSNWAEAARSVVETGGSFLAPINADNYRLYALDWDYNRPTAFYPSCR